MRLELESESMQACNNITINGQAGETAALEMLCQRSANLIDAIEHHDSFAALQNLLRSFCQFDNLLLYVFADNAPPLLLGSTVPENRLKSQMADFVAGLYLLDPFVLAQHSGASGLIRLRDISPEGFEDSEFFQHHYRYTNVIDEIRFLTPIDHVRSVHVFVEREGHSAPFNDGELAAMQIVAPLVGSFMQAKCRWLDRLERHGETANTATSIDLQHLIATMGQGSLTLREREVVEWLLKGHSSRSIGHVLDIEEGTVTNHKRNIYAKLNVHSMAQMFSLFLKSLE